MSIKTNNQPRELLYLSDFSEKDQAIEFNYGFFRYRGNIYHLQDFVRYSGDYWDGCLGLNYFAAVLIKLTSDCDHVVVGFQST